MEVTISRFIKCKAGEIATTKKACIGISGFNDPKQSIVNFHRNAINIYELARFQLSQDCIYRLTG